MTTIVYSRETGIMAADRRCVNGYETICAPVTKIRRLEDGALVGCAGSITALSLACDWLDGQCVGRFDGPPKTDIMVVSPDGDVHQIQDGVMYEIADEYPALGSGAYVAIGAMAAGAGAEQAVKIAMRFDPFSGDGVDTLHLDGTITA